MRSLTLLTPHFAPESNAGAKRATAMAELLVSRGWKVTVITQLPHYPDNRLHDGFDRVSPFVEESGRLKVVRLRPWMVAKGSLLLRMLSETLFTVLAAPHVLRAGSSVLLASSPYMFLGPAGLALASFQRRAFAWDVRDLTWLYPRAAGKRTLGLDLLLDKLMRWTASRSHLLTTATEGLLDYFDHRPPGSAVIHNGVTRAAFEVLSALPDARTAPQERPLVAYVGLFGFNHGVMTIVEAAKLLPRIDFVLVGGGPDRDALVAAAHQLDNLRVEPYQQFESLLSVYAAADLLVSHVRRNPIFEWTQPVKLWEYMATGRPVVHAGQGEAVVLLEDNVIAVCVEPEDPAALAAAIASLLLDPERASHMGRRGQRFVREHRLREDALTELEVRLRRLSDGSHPDRDPD